MLIGSSQLYRVYSVQVLDDGSCASGAQRGIILSRRPGKIPEDAIAQMDSIADQPCANRENYQWVEHTGELEHTS